MKEDISKIFGKEWRWFLSLALMMKLRVIWFVVSFCFVVMLTESCGIIGFLSVLNLCASSFALRGVNGDGLNE